MTKNVNKNEGDGYFKPITAWAVEIEGKIDPLDVYPTRATARYVRNVEASMGLYKKVSVRKNAEWNKANKRKGSNND